MNAISAQLIPKILSGQRVTENPLTQAALILAGIVSNDLSNPAIQAAIVSVQRMALSSENPEVWIAALLSDLAVSGSEDTTLDDDEILDQLEALISGATADQVFTINGFGVPTLQTGLTNNDPINSIDRRIAGLTGTVAQKTLLSTVNPNVSYVRSATCWAADIDTTPIAVWCGEGGTNINDSNGWKRAIAISPIHVVMAVHFSPAIGQTFDFLTAGNLKVTRTLVARVNVIGTDIYIGKLSAELPDTISFCRILPNDYTGFSLIGMPVLELDQTYRVLVNDIVADNGVTIETSSTGPSDATRAAFYEQLVLGDSSSPLALVVGNELVLLASAAAAIGGPSLAGFRAAVDAAMTTLGGGYTTTAVVPRNTLWTHPSASVVLDVPTVAVLKTLPAATPDGTTRNVLGYYAAGDVRARVFTYDAASTAADNGGTVLRPASLPAAGRWIWTPNGPTDVTEFGAIPGDAVTDSVAFQAAATACPDGGAVLVPDGTYILTSAITHAVGKNITWIIHGKILDRLATWTEVLNDLTTTGKGVFAFSGGNVSIIGNGKVHFDGGAGTAVSQVERHMFYFYNCDSVLVKDINTELGLGRAVGTYGCRNITHRDCIHSGGYAPVVHRSAANCLIDNVTVTGGRANGIGVSNRGFIEQATLAWTRGVNVRIVNCYVVNTIKVSYAVGITIDAVDNYVCANNVVDGSNGITTTGIGTFAYSFADTSNGTVIGNLARNFNNIATGGDLPGGLGMECVRCYTSSFIGNMFENVMCGYRISGADCIYDGTYVNIPASIASISDAATACFAFVGDDVITTDNIRISGMVKGGNSGVVIAGTCNRVDIIGLHVVEPFQRFLTGNPAPTASVTSLTIKDSSWSTTGAGPVGCIVFNANVAANITISGFRAKAASATAGKAFLYSGSAGSKVWVDNVSLENFDLGFNFSVVAMTSLHVRHCDFIGVATQFNSTGNIVNFSARDLTVAGVPSPSLGQAPLETGLTATGPVKTQTDTLAALGAAGTVGRRAFITDGNTTLTIGIGLAAVGGGANKVPVFDDGANWIVG